MIHKMEKKTFIVQNGKKNNYNFFSLNRGGGGRCKSFQCKFCGFENVKKIFHQSLLHLNILHGFCGWFSQPWINFLTASNVFRFFAYCTRLNYTHPLIQEGLCSKKKYFMNSIYNHPWWKSRFNARLARM